MPNLSSANFYHAHFDNVAFAIGPLSIKWYGIAYITSFLITWYFTRWYIRRAAVPVMTLSQLDDLIVWLVSGVLVGGRIGYVLFYNLTLYLHKPWEILYVWQGGMSFHGAFLGVALALFLFTKKHHINFWKTADMLSLVTPIGLFFGRLANFINGELWGRVTDVPWAVVFSRSQLPRHPSQLYEAILEGFFLFVLLISIFTCKNPKISRWFQKPGSLTGLFLLGYAVVRFLVEFYREPDPQLGYLWLHLTMGQYLTLPLALLGIYLLIRTSNDQKTSKS